MAKSPVTEKLNQVQRALGSELSRLGFVRKGRTFNRSPEEGLVQVINLQAGPYDPPGSGLPDHMAHLRPNLYGLFAVNLGVSVAEIGTLESPKFPPKFFMDYNCHMRRRLSRRPDEHEHWWDLAAPADDLAAEVGGRLTTDGLAFLDRYGSRGGILAHWIADCDGPMAHSPRARVDVAVILHARGRKAEAAALLAEQARTTEVRPHALYVSALSERLGLGAIEI